MTDREKVIEELEMSYNYSNVDENNTLVPQWIVLHAIALLKEDEQAIKHQSDHLDALLKAQEPRVMTLEEVLALKFDDVVYVEVVPTHAVLSAIVLDVIPKLPKIGIGVVQFRHAPTWNGINNADLNYYSKTWRCWTSRPDEKRRAETPWN